MPIYNERGFDQTKDTQQLTFQAGEKLFFRQWVKRSVSDPYIIVEALTAEEAIGYVLDSSGVDIGMYCTVQMKSDLDTVSGGGGGGNWTPTGLTNFAAGGITVGTDLGTDPISIQETLLDILYGYLPPQTNIITVPGSGLRESGDYGSLTSIDLSALTIKKTSDITSFVFKKNGTDIYTSLAPNPAGGTETFEDTDGVTGNTTYQAVVSDGTGTGTAIKTFTFASAYYYGVGLPGLSPAAVSGLTKVVQTNSATYAADFSPSGEVYYFAYPSSYPALTSILDNSSFETISDWTVTTANITNSFGITTSYRIYEFNNITTQTDFTNTFIQ